MSDTCETCHRRPTSRPVPEAANAEVTPYEMRPPQEALLSTREALVVRLIATGTDKHDISRMLDISIKTFDTHRQNALKKLLARNNADLTRWALRYGLVHLDGSAPVNSIANLDDNAPS